MKRENLSSIFKILAAFFSGLAGTTTGGVVYNSFKDSNFKVRFSLKADISWKTNNSKTPPSNKKKQKKIVVKKDIDKNQKLILEKSVDKKHTK